MTPPLRTALLCLAAALLAGCSTPSSRIKDKPEWFAALPAEAQARVQRGEVRVGDTPEAVFLALGTPSRKYGRTTAQGEAEVWSYTDVDLRTESRHMRVPVHYRDRDGRSRTSYETVWVDVQHRDEYEKIRVEFQNGRVFALETTRR